MASDGAVTVSRWARYLYHNEFQTGNPRDHNGLNNKINYLLEKHHQ